MKFGVNLPPFGDFADARRVGDLAREAEHAGWDGFFLWDHVAIPWDDAVADPWICLAAAALTTSRIRLGTMVTPLARRRQQKLARETVTLDRLAGGRLVLGVGLGLFAEEFDNLADTADPRIRGDMLDEALDVLTGLWTAAPFSHSGKHYRVDRAHFTPPPVQRPRIPIWVAGMWPNRPPFRRAAKWDGVFPITPDPFNKTLAPGDFLDILGYVAKYRTATGPFEVVHGGFTQGSTAEAAMVGAYRDAGVTWWLEAVSPDRVDRIRHGPPTL
jgi:alkanesulfonate monooxygenase SsuD/methylene tetrahydromethanopterin reductase-like flavin-dependent oxidoreductase (luciferase family)